jgi:shikimate dehydrogenase
MKPLLCGLIGAGIQRSLAPLLQEEEARNHGVRMHYQLIDLDSAGRGNEALPGLIDAARVMGFAGLNITYPCKQAVMPLLDEVAEEARAIGAVNTARAAEGGPVAGRAARRGRGGVGVRGRGAAPGRCAPRSGG